MTMNQSYRLEVPPEPPVGTLLQSTHGGRVKRLPDGWAYHDTEKRTPESYRVRMNWRTLLEAFPGGLEDVTPLRTWELPPLPETGTKMQGSDGAVFEVRQDNPDSLPYIWTEGDPVVWSAVLNSHGPLTEIR